MADSKIIEGNKTALVSYLQERLEFEQSKVTDMSIPLYQRDYAKGAVHALEFAIDAAEDWHDSDLTAARDRIEILERKLARLDWDMG